MSPKNSLLVLAVGFAVLWSFAGSRKPAPAEPPTVLSSAHAHENLTVFVLRGPDVLESGNILTLQEALEKGLAVVHETGSVNLLEVENLSVDHELFLQSGDIVKGGKQDRIIADDMLVQAKSGKVPCPANCCEQSRWQPRGGEVATKFEKSTDFAVGNDIKIANQAGFQGLVWDSVAKKQAAISQNLGKSVTANASPTSLQLALEDKDLRAKVAGYERSLGGLANAYPDAVGVVLAVNGQVIASDVYGSKELFRKAWPKLLKSAAVDAVAQMPKGEVAIAERSEAVAFLANRKSESASVSERRDELTYADRGLNSDIANNLQVELTRAISEPVGNHETPENEKVANASLNDALRTRLIEARSNPPGQPAPQLPAFNGRSGATRPLQTALAGQANPIGNNSSLNIVGDLNPSLPAMDSYIMGNGSGVAPRPASPGVVSFESRAGSQKNALIHRGQLKK